MYGAIDTEVSPSPTGVATTTEYKVYRRRWLYLTCICLANMSNSILWINFASIANLAKSYFDVSYSSINWLSLIFMIVCSIFTLPSTWAIDKFGIRFGILTGVSLNLIGGCFRVISTWGFVSVKGRYPIVFIGQFICAFAQTFTLFIPAKFSFIWFPHSQRTLATSLCFAANFLGVFIGTVLPPIIVPHEDKIPLLLYLSLIPAVIAAILALSVRSSEPPTPSSLASRDIKVPYKLVFKKLLKSKSYVILFLTVGIGLSNNNTLSTLLQQIMCPFGYGDIAVGLCIGCFIMFGLIGCITMGIVADKTQKLEEITKILYSIGVISLICIGLFVINEVKSYWLYIVFAIAGFTNAPVLPLSFDLSIETTHPVPEATVSGIFMIASQLGSIIAIIILPNFTSAPSAHQMEIQQCEVQGAKTNDIRDYSVPVYILAAFAVVLVICFISFFHCEYRRQKNDEVEHDPLAMSVTLHTDLGDIKIELCCDQCPKACENFLALCGSNYYDNCLFHRNVKGYMIQTGDPSGTGKGGQSIWGEYFPDEIDPHLKHSQRGIVSMASRGADTNGSQFFITYGKQVNLDGKYTVFGKVIDGFETLDELEKIPVNEKNYRPETDVRIQRVTIHANPLAD
ncbi:unnamed protein product [Rotaria magnacalcarata]|uniref:peptidylprolyl isomerase n=2 Tax=Rotaria magnacalcarata TaxID=392030 RepID=A0A819DQJ5_9BILA|nr:unnamed protein product [Rotaria magnacalcarata]